MSGTVPEVKAREAAAAATRLLQDPYLSETLDEIVASSAQLAINHPDPATREENRQAVLAVQKLRGTLQSVFENWRMAVERPAREEKWE